MKKLILILVITISCMHAFSQTDSIELMDQTVQNELPALGYMFHWYIDGPDTLVRLVRGKNIQPFFMSTSRIYPRSTSYSLVLGTTPSISTNTKLWVDGTGYFSGNLTLNSQLYIGSSSVYVSSDELYFQDPTNGTVALSDLISGGSYSVSNGLTTSGDYFILGGSIDRNTTIDLNNYSIQWGNGSDYLLLDEATGINRLNAASQLILYGEYATLQSSSGFRLRSSSGNANTWHDYTSTPYGLTMPDWETYWANIESDDEEGALISYGMMEEYVSENGGAGGSGNVGTNDTTCLDDADVAYMRLYQNTEEDTFRWVQVTIDTLADDMYLATMSLTSANITSGASVVVLASPGSNKQLIPLKYTIYYDYETAAYTSDNATYSAIIKYTTSGEVISSVPDDVFEAAQDVSFIPLNVSDDDVLLNVSDAFNNGITIDFYTHTGSGTGDGVMKLWYTTADYN